MASCLASATVRGRRGLGSGSGLGSGFGSGLATIGLSVSALGGGGLGFVSGVSGLGSGGGGFAGEAGLLSMIRGTLSCVPSILGWGVSFSDCSSAAREFWAE